MARFFSFSLAAGLSFGLLASSALAQDDAPPLVQLLGRWELASGECSEAYVFAMHGDNLSWNTTYHGADRANELQISVTGDRIVPSNNHHSFVPHGDTLDVFFNNEQICTFRRAGTTAAPVQTDAAAEAPPEPVATPEQTPVVEQPKPEPDPAPPMPRMMQVSALDQIVGRWEWEGGQCSQTYVFEVDGDVLRWTTIQRGRGYPVTPPYTIDGERISLDDGHSFAPRGDQLFVLMNGRPVCMFRRVA